MSSVTVSHVSKSVAAPKLKEFFAFCGVIRLVDELGADENGYNKYRVNFELEKALSTALLLNDAELDSVPIVVKEESLPSYDDLPDKQEGAGDHKIQSLSLEKADAATITGDSDYDDILQEEKPKLAILAQLLALGYLLSDDLINRAVKFDNEKGYTTKFKSFLTDLDQKYVVLARMPTEVSTRPRSSSTLSTCRSRVCRTSRSCNTTLTRLRPTPLALKCTSSISRSRRRFRMCTVRPSVCTS